MKKILRMVICIALLCTLLGGFSVMATQANIGEIAVESVTAKPGDTIEVPVVLKKNPGIVSLYISIGYDQSALKLNSVTDAALLTDYQSGDKKLNPFTVSWEMASATENNVSTGTLVLLNFTVLETVSAGEYEITVEEYGTGNVYDYDLNDVEFEYRSGEVSVKVPEHEHMWGDWDTVKEATCEEDGLKECECTVTGCNEKDSEIVPRLGHNLGDWVVEEEAGINKDGLKRRECTRCDYDEEEIIPGIKHGEADHVFDGKEEVIKEATCKEAGQLRTYCSFEGCNKYKDTEIEVLGHEEGEFVEVKEPTCEEKGLKEKYCTVCEELVASEEIKELGHNLGNWVVEEEAGINKDGLKRRECTRCDYDEEEIIPGIKHGEEDHVFDGKEEVIKEATCKEAGRLRTYCSFEGCNKYKDTEIEVLGHEEGEFVEVKEPTCEEKGLKEKYCTVCEELVASEEIKELGHNLGNWVVEEEAGINKDGLKRRECTRCDYDEEEIIPGIKHGEEDHVFDGKEEVIKEATCKEAGQLRTYCSFEGCNKYKDTEIEVLGHEEGEFVEVKEPTCEEKGLKEKYCTVCEELVASEEIKELGHNLGDWVVEEEAGINKDGLKRRECTRCDYDEEEIILAIKHGEEDHVFDGKEEVVKEATCKEAGRLRTYCSFEGCNKYKDTEIEALGHEEGEFVEVKEPTCEEKGLKEKYCTVCEELLVSEEIKELGHNLGDWVVEEEAGINKDGLKRRECTRCDYDEEEIIPAIKHGEADHVFDGKEVVVKEATCTETGTLRKYCSFEDCNAYMDITIEVLKHTEGEFVEVKAPTCEEKGLKEKYCTVCEELLVSEEIEALEHDLGDWVVEKEAGINEEGLKRRECIRCDYDEEEIIPAIKHGEADHVFDGREEVIKEATCQAEGILRTYCSSEDCEEYIETVIKKVDHKYENGQCKYCGKKKVTSPINNLLDKIKDIFGCGNKPETPDKPVVPDKPEVPSKPVAPNRPNVIIIKVSKIIEKIFKWWR